ncbi:penicillin-binding transpeptidase domain-containing protein [Streptomyces sp. NBC_01481]|uniref:penicillin-binding transpeptidase domain-containing protein n=1 Tax=Streptomyces sp. NBC_01481 TaxID=2975869 RepID=UPI00225787A0|nr:penicillin-binding transpeptidase domain-containing protein [Streptomyces sp. NBC_01481]MCX4585129.1 penicillin-binding transpeptidase domain-containing protein [Streptomyces sp. NBC_01481]
MGKRRRAARSRTNPALIGGVVAVVVGGAGFAGYSMYSGDAAGEDSTADRTARTLAAGPVKAAEVQATADGFLTAWQRGDAAKAAAFTDRTAAARAALSGYRKDAHIDEVTLTRGKASGPKVTFRVSATVSYKGKSKPLTYDSELTVVRAEDGKPLVRWQPSVVHPDLKEGDTLVTGEADPPVRALDRNGAELTTAKYPSLGTVLDGLREKYGRKAGGKAGVELRVVRGDSAKKSEQGAEESEDQPPNKTLLTMSKGIPGTLRTTLSATAQAVAEREVGERERASVVVMKPSTGEILAAANSSHGYNTALQGSLAPGSTMKIVTASMLLEKNLASIDKQHPCPKYASYGGWKFQNVENFEIKNGTFRSSFAASCNTAFITQAGKLDDDDLTKQAQQVFGLGLNNWSTGVSSFDGAVPVQSNAQMASSLIGQGGVRMNPLNVASIISTAKTGIFRQPYLVSPDVDDRSLATAQRKLDASAQTQLHELLSYTATSGSAAEAMAGLGPDIGGKTGSAEVDGQEKPNGWFTAWRGDLAAAAVVQQGGRGGKSAGPLVAAVLRAGG